MSITVLVPTVLRSYCEGAARLTLPAATVGAALARIEKDHPSLYPNICDETGAVRRHINIFVNTTHMRDREGLDTPLASGDVLMILFAVSGGSTCRTK